MPRLCNQAPTFYARAGIHFTKEQHSMTKLALSLILLCTSAFAQTSFTNQGHGACTDPRYPGVYYCTSMPRYENGVQVGYLAFWLKLNADGLNFSNGELWIQDMTGSSQQSYVNFSGTFNGSVFNGTFSNS